MILLLSSFVTNQRGHNRYSRINIFRYMLYSYRNIPFTEIYLFILLDNEFLHVKNELTNFIYSNFANLKQEHIHITFDRYYQQQQWIPFIIELQNKHGENELVWFTQNDDHVFVDFNMDILNEGLELLKLETNNHKSIYFSHWPEILKMSGKYQTPILINNYIKFNLSLLDSIQIFNLKMLYHIFVEYKWKHDHIRIDSVLNELTTRPSVEDPLLQTIYVPLREMVRHFDGYEHTNMDITACPPLELPINTFDYSNASLIKKMTASHSSAWTQNNSFRIPQEWININISLHTQIQSHSVCEKNISDKIIYNLNINNINNFTPISLGWNCGPAQYRKNILNVKKCNGYLTCPFDLGVTPYSGLCQCILDDFDKNKFFNLRVEYDPINKQDCILNEYNMWFNHESEPIENNDRISWYPGKYQLADFKLFKQRYEDRIDNFKKYIENDNIIFILENSHDDVNYLINILNYKYPSLNYKLLCTNTSSNILYDQHLHSHGFPNNKNDYEYLYNFKKQFKQFVI